MLEKLNERNQINFKDTFYLTQYIQILSFQQKNVIKLFLKSSTFFLNALFNFRVRVIFSAGRCMRQVPLESSVATGDGLLMWHSRS